jgi:hypothetical protein
LEQSRFECARTDGFGIGTYRHGREEKLRSHRGSPVNPGLIDNVVHSTIAVPGATDVTLYQQATNPFAVVTLYSGDSLEEAIKVYEATAGDFKLCDAKGVKITSDEKPEPPQRRLTFENLTGYSEELVTQFEEKDKTATAPLEYSVSWNIYPTD